MSLQDKKIIVGLTGGIAAYKTPNFIRLLKKDDAEVRAIMTDAATKFITELTIETVSQNPVAREMFPADRYVGTHHIDLADWPDLFVIAPATANFIAKIASGICDDLLTTVICATKKPVIIAPAMNTNMYLNPVTQKNIQYLKSLGYIFIDPNEGELACNVVGWGRMAEPEEIYQFVLKYLQKKKSLTGKKVTVTAGPCREPLDPVRYISNRSSGKMGYALAAAARDAGAEVTLISGPSALRTEPDINLLKVETTAEMFAAVKKRFRQTDILIMAAAPADFKPRKIEKNKIKKGKDLSIELTGTVDILQSLIPMRRKSQLLVGFALETENGIINAKAKLRDKGLDMIVLNSTNESPAFESDSNKVSLIYKNGRSESLPLMSKTDLAPILIDRIAKLKNK
ncbi:Coenzyme A biosynthesis bifunctional protein CoaBC (Includes: Phosphopantothenoylcysteine decarboxylase; Phosphopantothenate--cysteine ligase) [Candidatus Zixiibacteriota bacterium]|nr:Coenzyme A biosynthesis bifunctional protein CoaBC (Includes: Phosphopantothenoylcysteine decarboxylase; Phosphopantothenate--cysteine ligase) [candidate division Zixibacteria bacterium]